ncbi:MAG TPA: hypothetical protein VEI06_06775 [Gemmatimonadaceae bacterium]|nr:hypothetical protein [Gemmatimonadaceae bacterium]
MRAICIARHRYLSEHICDVFADLGIDCRAAVGFESGSAAARELRPDVVVCDYDLLVAAPLPEWECDATLRTIPVIAVSLTRRPDEVHVVDINGIAGFLYLPAVARDALERVVQAAASRDVSSAGAEHHAGPRMPTEPFHRTLDRHSAPGAA